VADSDVFDEIGGDTPFRWLQLLYDLFHVCSWHFVSCCPISKGRFNGQPIFSFIHAGLGASWQCAGWTVMPARPAFYGQVTGDGARLTGLSSVLAESAALGDATGLYQAYLWSMSESGQPGYASGISAFPGVRVRLIAIGLGRHHAKAGYASAALVITHARSAEAGLQVAK
jgi:hypothetical protein